MAANPQVIVPPPVGGGNPAPRPPAPPVQSQQSAWDRFMYSPIIWIAGGLILIILAVLTGVALQRRSERNYPLSQLKIEVEKVNYLDDYAVNPSRETFRNEVNMRLEAARKTATAYEEAGRKRR